MPSLDQIDKPKYFTKHLLSGQIIAIVQGEHGYNTTTVDDLDYAQVLNERQGHSPEQVKAAEMCSMSGNWDNFDEITETFLNKTASQSAQK